jgi:uncharacterized protein (DUF2235 family)
LAKNILLFADGTGNEGGLLPDESRTNVYKLYRATRNGPGTSIDPRKQIAFYLHGIGTPTPGEKPRKIRQTWEQMFGGGLASRIIDGYAAIIKVCGGAVLDGWRGLIPRRAARRGEPLCRRNT